MSHQSPPGSDVDSDLHGAGDILSLMSLENFLSLQLGSTRLYRGIDELDLGKEYALRF